MRSPSRFQPFSSPSLRTSGLRRLKTAFSPSPTSSASVASVRSLSSTPRSSPGSIGYASTSTSPASSDCGCDDHHHNVGTIGSIGGGLGGLQLMGLDQALEESMPKAQVKESSGRFRLRQMLMMRRKRLSAKWETAVEEQVKIVGPAPMRLFEPRQSDQVVMSGIFEVLDDAR